MYKNVFTFNFLEFFILIPLHSKIRKVPVSNNVLWCYTEGVPVVQVPPQYNTI